MDDIPKIVAVDANVLICVCEGESERKEKLMHLFSRVSKAKGKIIVPTPAIAEFLVNADHAGLTALETLKKRSSVFIASFDLAAAYEASQMDAAAKGRGNKREGVDERWQKIKIDRQIVAIAKSNGAKAIVSDDESVRAAAARVGIHAWTIEELSIPDHARQAKLPIDELQPTR